MRPTISECSIGVIWISYSAIWLFGKRFLSDEGVKPTELQDRARKLDRSANVGACTFSPEVIGSTIDMQTM